MNNSICFDYQHDYHYLEVLGMKLMDNELAVAQQTWLISGATKSRN